MLGTSKQQQQLFLNTAICFQTLFIYRGETKYKVLGPRGVGDFPKAEKVSVVRRQLSESSLLRVIL